ncbi:MAG: hypothetical protein JO125_06460 [Chloroflexi bacterium]|nr:hypothetical protein [Chloroflexota bacterium]
MCRTNETEDLYALADLLDSSCRQHMISGPTTVAELQMLLGEIQSKRSNHLAMPWECDLVRTTRERRQKTCEL